MPCLVCHAQVDLPYRLNDVVILKKGIAEEFLNVLRNGFDCADIGHSEGFLLKYVCADLGLQLLGVNGVVSHFTPCSNENSFCAVSGKRSLFFLLPE